MKKKNYTVPIIVVVGLFLLTMMLLVAVTPMRRAVRPAVQTVQEVVRAAPTDYTGRAHVEVIDQSVSGGQISLLSVALKESGYVVIHKEEKGKPGQIIGISPLIQAGLYSNGSVQLIEPVSPGDTLFVMLHSDDGDEAFSSETDQPLTDNKGMMIMNEFAVL